MSFEWKGKFKEAPSELLKHYQADVLRRAEFIAAIHELDKAHLVMLAESALAPSDATRALAAAFDAMETQGIERVRGSLWNVINGVDEFLRKECGNETAGWMQLGRPAPCIRVVASRIGIREKLLQAMASALRLREVLMSIASAHLDTAMPGYAYLQHLEPTTLGFYAMSWVAVLERDFQRFENAYRNTNVSAIGAEIGHGTQFGIDVDRMDALLGFSQSAPNARDAIRNYDYILDCYMALALLHNNLGRLAMDLVVWASVEFNMIQLADRYCVTASILPQIRVPYVLEFIHGASGMMAGRLMSALAINKTASDQLEPATLLPAELWDCFDESESAVEALTGALATMEVDKQRMGQLAAAHWSQSSTLLGFLVKQKGFSFDSAAGTLALFMKRIAAQRVLPDDPRCAAILKDAVKETAGKELALGEDELARALDLRSCIDTRDRRGGMALQQVRKHLKAAHVRLDSDNRKMSELYALKDAAMNELNRAFRSLPR